LYAVVTILLDTVIGKHTALYSAGSCEMCNSVLGRPNANNSAGSLALACRS
jgi:hypothetical protein